MENKNGAEQWRAFIGAYRKDQFWPKSGISGD